MTTPAAAVGRSIPGPWRNHRGELDGALLGRTSANGMALWFVWDGYSGGHLPVPTAVGLCLAVAVVEAVVYHLRRSQDVTAETDRAKARLQHGAAVATARGNSGLWTGTDADGPLVTPGPEIPLNIEAMRRGR